MADDKQNKPYMVLYRRWEDSPTSTNIALAPCEEAVRANYEHASWVSVQEMGEAEFKEYAAEKPGIPVIKLEWSDDLHGGEADSAESDADEAPLTLAEERKAVADMLRDLDLDREGGDSHTWLSAICDCVHHSDWGWTQGACEHLRSVLVALLDGDDEEDVRGVAPAEEPARPVEGLTMPAAEVVRRAGYDWAVFECSDDGMAFVDFCHGRRRALALAEEHCELVGTQCMVVGVEEQMRYVVAPGAMPASGVREDALLALADARTTDATWRKAYEDTQHTLDLALRHCEDLRVEWLKADERAEEQRTRADEALAERDQAVADFHDATERAERHRAAAREKGVRCENLAARLADTEKRLKAVLRGEGGGEPDRPESDGRSLYMVEFPSSALGEVSYPAFAYEGAHAGVSLVGDAMADYYDEQRVCAKATPLALQMWLDALGILADEQVFSRVWERDRDARDRAWRDVTATFEAHVAAA